MKPNDDADLFVEARRQQALVAAIAALNADGAVDRSTAPAAQAVAAHGAEGGPRTVRGLAAYRANAGAISERALEAVFPTVRTMLGASDFAHAARSFVRETPPERGDLGEWGAAFPAWLAAQPALAEWPYLGDCAALELARHRCERAADVVADLDSLATLGHADPATLRIRLVPGTAVLSSRWPIATIDAAHRSAEADAVADPGFAAVRAALAERRGEAVLVVREGWRAVVRAIDAPTQAWLVSLLEGADLASALDRAGPSFDVAAWLAAAIEGGWMRDVVCTPAG
jgi:hypothetical protein